MTFIVSSIRCVTATGLACIGSLAIAASASVCLESSATSDKAVVLTHAVAVAAADGVRLRAFAWQPPKAPVSLGHSPGGLVTTPYTLLFGDKLKGLALDGAVLQRAKSVGDFAAGAAQVMG